MYSRKDFDVVVGMEFHAQLNCLTKLFSPAALNVNDDINTNVALVDAGMPGCLPVLNEMALYKGIRTSLALNMQISNECRFDRKHYSYPDLPLGYQITQQSYPLGYDGYITLETGKKIRFERLCLETDAAKNIHHGDYTTVDFNRSGAGLMEIVTAPDISSAEEMLMTFHKLRNIVKILDTCNADMYKGELRADVNISLNLKGQPYGVRVEIKNLNSMQYAYQAIEYEIARHIKCINDGVPIIMETRSFDPVSCTTKSMRNKEQEADYRFFSESNLPSMLIEREYVQKIKDELPELPDAIMLRWVSLGIPVDSAKLLLQETEYISFINKGIELLKEKGLQCFDTLALLTTQDLFALCNSTDTPFAKMKLTIHNFVRLIEHLNKDHISIKQAKELLKEIYSTDDSCDAIITSKGIQQISDEYELAEIIRKVLADNPDEVQRYRQGEKKLLGFLVGQTMKVTQNQANPKLLNVMLTRLLD